MNKIKFIKTILISFVLFLAFIEETNSYQNHIPQCLIDEYPQINANFSGETSRVEFWNDINEYAEEKGYIVLAYSDHKKDLIYRDVIFFGEYDVVDRLLNDNYMSVSQYHSFSSGDTEIKITSFDSLVETNNRFINRFSVIGSNEDAEDIINHFSDKYEMFYEAEYGYVEDLFVNNAIWILLICVMIVFVIFEVAYNSKEVALKASLGENTFTVITKNILIDTILYILAFVVMRTVVFSLYDGSYLLHRSLILLGVGVVVNSIVYLAYVGTTRNFGKVLRRNNKNVVFLIGMYTLKLICSLTVLITVGIEINTLFGAYGSLSNTNNLEEKLSGYAYISIEDLRPPEEDYEERINSLRWNKYDELYHEYYDQLKPIICTSIEYGDEFFAVIANSNADILLDDFEEIKQDNSDIVVMIPSKFVGRKDIENFCTQIISYDYSVETHESINYYSDNRKVSTIDGNGFNYDVETAVIANPVLIYVKDSIISSMISASSWNMGTIYKVTAEELDSIDESIGVSKDDFEFIYTNYVEFSRYVHGALRQIVQFLASAVVLIIVIQIFIILVISKMEYEVRAKEISVKSILGYSLLKKYSRKFVLNVFLDTAALAISITALLILGKINAIIGLIVVFTMLVIFDIVVVSLAVLRIETKSNVKTLKGGCL